jgi:trans-2,3-dihydro-3-hydroxyanthranilate isomerase
MAPYSLYIVDVFAESRYTGNQLAVVANAESLSDGEMQAIAREMNFSETTFVMSGGSGERGYDVRIFLPTVETDFAGHPTLGSAWVIRNEIDPSGETEIPLNLKIGRVPVTFEDRPSGGEIVWMHAPTPELGSVHTAEDVAPMLGIGAHDIDPGYPVQEVSVGLPFIFVPVKDLSVLSRCRLDLGRRPAVLHDPRFDTLAFIFCSEARDPANQFSARMFFDSGGLREDPATGSANACFAAYLLEHEYGAGGPVDVRVEQGYDMGRPSLLHLKASEHEEGRDIRVGGRVIPVARATLL